MITIATYKTSGSCKKCGTNLWWLRPAPVGKGEFIACLECYPPEVSYQTSPHSSVDEHPPEKPSRTKTAAMPIDDTIHASRLKHIKREAVFLEFLEKNYPGEWKHIGNNKGTKRFNGYPPDYTHTSRNILIELEYNDMSKTKHRRQVCEDDGYKLIVIDGRSFERYPENIIELIDNSL